MRGTELGSALSSGIFRAEPLQQPLYNTCHGCSQLQPKPLSIIGVQREATALGSRGGTETISGLASLQEQFYFWTVSSNPFISVEFIFA